MCGLRRPHLRLTTRPPRCSAALIRGRLRRRLQLRPTQTPRQRVAYTQTARPATSTTTTWTQTHRPETIHAGTDM